ncbi:uncharacterized protein TNCT_606411 [Trichonephila clavata]|uniref:Uncharacterized protein n=1 Tax=Trichonephila clavata TaxID=2740835 RepID=A0A8X6KS66_TRICU|nr:uncharacterized protein TNCT_606411 [Trichonephila clavata]
MRKYKARTTEFGGYISGNVILNSLDSPYEIRKDVIIESGSSLVIKPGVELRFAPGIGITVMKEAVLEARFLLKNLFCFFLGRTPTFCSNA